MMRTVLMAMAMAMAASTFLAPAAMAQEPARMDNEAYVRATACAAYGSLASLAQDGVDVSAIVSRVNAERQRKPVDVQRRASREVRNALLAEHQGAPIAELRERRDRTCAAFLATPKQVAGGH